MTSQNIAGNQASNDKLLSHTLHKVMGSRSGKNRSLMEKARSMLQEARAPNFLWAEAINYVAYILNCSPTRSNPRTTPEGSYTRRRPKIFGSKTFIHIPKEERRKLLSKSIEGFILGIDDEKKGYRCYVPSKRKILVSQDVKIDESTLLATPIRM